MIRAIIAILSGDESINEANEAYSLTDFITLLLCRLENITPLVWVLLTACRYGFGGEKSYL